jgi:hydroxymethylpyrimidine/phosphomethylpyrimidine kinase
VERVSLTDPGLVRDQIASVTSDVTVAATKTGMLASAAIIETVAAALHREAAGPVVVDPVMVAKSGDALIDDAAVTTLAQTLLPLARVATPNRGEVRRLLARDAPLRSVDEAGEAARQIGARFGCRACVVKAIPQGGEVVDVLWDGEAGEAPITFTAPQRPAEHTHGSGCAFSAAIAAGLAHGQPLPKAVKQAKTLIDTAIAAAPALGHGSRPVDPLAGGLG